MSECEMNKNKEYYEKKQKPLREKDKYNREVVLPKLFAERSINEAKLQILERENKVLVYRNRALEERILQLEKIHKD